MEHGKGVVMMRCKYCGEYLRGTSIYCDKCGRKVEIDLDSTRVFDFDLSKIDIPDRETEEVREPLIKRGNFLPMFLSVSSLICVMALCVSVLTYAINYDMRSQKLNRTSNIDAGNGLELNAKQTRPPETALPAEVTTETTTTAPAATTTTTSKQTTTTSAKETTTTTRQTTTTTRKTTTTTTTTSKPETASTTTKDDGAWWKKKSETSSETTTTLFPKFELTSTTTTTTAKAAESEPEADGDIVIPETTKLIDTMYVANDKGELFLRKGPGYGYDFVNFLGISPATEADIYAQEFDDGSGEMWVYISSAGYSGWTTMSMLSHTKPSLSTERHLTYFSAQTSKKTDMYSGAGKFYTKKGTITKGTYVEILEFSDSYDWLYVCADGKYGWIKAENVEMEGYV